MTDWKNPIHPGEILADELEFIEFDAAQLAQRLDIPENYLAQILQGQSNMTAELALRLGRFFNTGAELWMNLQKAYELDLAHQQLGNTLELITPYQSSSTV